MLGVYNWVRQATLAALLLSPTTVSAEVRAAITSPTGSIIVSGLEAHQRRGLVENKAGILLQIESLENHGTMALSVQDQDGLLFVEPTFSLRAGEAYVLRLQLGNDELFEAVLLLPSDDVTRPELSWFAPADTVIPENTLRLYLMFSEPMALGQVREAVWLERANGSIIDSPFLNLHAELWDGEQRRLTLLFDPGRIKQGVGPNETDGAPLRDGERYFVVLSADLASAAGQTIGSEIRLPLTVGPAQRDALAPSKWVFTAPEIGSTDALEVHFDRPMDRGASERLITVIGPSVDTVSGFVQSNGTAWYFTPNLPWLGTEGLRIDPDLEDVSGNTIGAPFDAAAGTIGQMTDATTIEIFEMNAAD